MNSEMRGTSIWLGVNVKAMVIITMLLVFLTIITGGNHASDGLIAMYNKMYFIMLPGIAIVLPYQVYTMILIQLQFGASRKSLFHATEIGLFLIFIFITVCVVAMNAYSAQVYGMIEPEIWNVSPLEWVYVFMISCLFCKTMQRGVYKGMKSLSTFGKFKWGFVGGIFLGIMIITMLAMRGTFEITPDPSQTLITVISIVFFIVTGVIIAILHHSNYRLFMKMEVSL